MIQNSKRQEVKNIDLANSIRMLSVDAVQRANSGHPGMPMGMADVTTVLFKKFLKFDSGSPNWPNRDRFILSAGHGSMLLYSILFLSGYKDIDIEQIKNFRQLGFKTPGHPEYKVLDGIETTTGPLGQGLANAVGMALSEKMMNSRFGKEIYDHYTYVLAGDGCLMEGISHEVISIAGHLRLGKLIVLFDDNEVSIDGPTSLSVSDDQVARFRASNWHAIKCDGHDENSIESSIQEAIKDARPSLIAFKTKIGFGSPNKQGKASSHGSPMGEEEIKLIRQRLGWNHKSFVIPENILREWKKIGIRGENLRKKWYKALNNSEHKLYLTELYEGNNVQNIEKLLLKFKKNLVKNIAPLATRKASEATLSELTKVVKNMLGGSADLTGSNNTLVEGQKPINREDFSGSYIYYGVREHGMAAIMNGIALYGGFIPYGGTFLVFSDYCRPAIRLSALMGLRVIYVMTHDSIGLGEDGPTHQPIEHLSSLRAIPNLDVWRPADSIETLECWQAAISNCDSPSVIALSRQNVNPVRLNNEEKNLSSKGAYELIKNKNAILSLFASGTEVEIAVSASKKLAAYNITTRVISVPSIDRFFKQEKEYITSILGSVPKIVIEAGVIQSWESILTNKDAFIGMTSFGASAPAKDLYKHFNITEDEVIRMARSITNKRSFK